MGSVNRVHDLVLVKRGLIIHQTAKIKNGTIENIFANILELKSGWSLGKIADEKRPRIFHFEASG